MTQLWIIDSRLCRRPLAHGQQWVMLFTSPLAVPIDLLGTRRLKGCGLLLLHLVLFSVGYVTAATFLLNLRRLRRADPGDARCGGALHDRP
jgi:hypothetical protein